MISEEITNNDEVSKEEIKAIIKTAFNIFVIPLTVTVLTSNLLNYILYLVLILVFYKVVLRNNQSLAKTYFIDTLKIVSLVAIFMGLILLALVLI